METVVSVKRCSVESVAEIEELHGIISSSSSFPQYLHSAMLIGVRTVIIERQWGVRGSWKCAKVESFPIAFTLGSKQ